VHYYYGNKTEENRTGRQFIEHRNIARHVELWHLEDHDQQQQRRHTR